MHYVITQLFIHSSRFVTQSARPFMQKMKYSCKFFPFFAVSMKARTRTKRGITFLLLLIFFQQMGAGLFVHNLVHDNKTDQAPIEQRESGREINFACKCIDDFLMPFIGVDQSPVLKKLVLIVFSYGDYTESAYYTPLHSSPLRGPPVCIG